MILERSRAVRIIYWSWKNVTYLDYTEEAWDGVAEHQENGVLSRTTRDRMTWDPSFPTVPLRFLICKMDEL